MGGACHGRLEYVSRGMGEGACFALSNRFAASGLCTAWVWASGLDMLIARAWGFRRVRYCGWGLGRSCKSSSLAGCCFGPVLTASGAACARVCATVFSTGRGVGASRLCARGGVAAGLSSPLLEQPSLFGGCRQDHRLVRPIHLELNRHLAGRLPRACDTGEEGRN